MTRARMRRENELLWLPFPRGSASKVPGVTTKRLPFSMTWSAAKERRCVT